MNPANCPARALKMRRSVELARERTGDCSEVIHRPMKTSVEVSPWLTSSLTGQQGMNTTEIRGGGMQVVKDFPSTEELLTVEDLAKRLRVPRSWVYSHSEGLGAYRLGKYLRFSWVRVLERLEHVVLVNPE